MGICESAVRRHRRPASPMGLYVSKWHEEELTVGEATGILCALAPARVLQACGQVGGCIAAGLGLGLQMGLGRIFRIRHPSWIDAMEDETVDRRMRDWEQSNAHARAAERAAGAVLEAGPEQPLAARAARLRQTSDTMLETLLDDMRQDDASPSASPSVGPPQAPQADA